MDRLVDLNENNSMKRIRMIDPRLYRDILDAESEIYLKMHEEISELEVKLRAQLSEKLDDIKVVKDLALAYDTKNARRMFDNLVKKKRKPPSK